MSVYEFDIPGVAENNTPIPPSSPVSFGLESYGYMPSPAYAVPLMIGMNPVENRKWIGYPNARIGWGRSDDNAYIVPKVPINPKAFNSPRPYNSNANFAGQAPVKGIFTGVSDEVGPCR